MSRSNRKRGENLPVSKQTAGGVAGAVVGSALAGPVGAVVGGVAGTLMGNRAAKGESLVPQDTVKSVKAAAKVVTNKVSSAMPRLRGGASAAKKSGRNASAKKAASKPAAKGGSKTQSAKRKTPNR